MADDEGDHVYAAKKRKRSRPTGKFCCVAGCTGKHSDGLSVHSFPSDPSVRRQWIAFVRTHRADFTVPTINNFVCERHFERQCYPETYRLQTKWGFSVKRKMLEPGSVPTIFKATWTVGSSFAVSTSMTSTTCTTSTTTTSASSASATLVTALQRPVVSASIHQLPYTSKTRGAFAKREQRRVMDQILAEAENETEVLGDSHIDMDDECLDQDSKTCETGTQTSNMVMPYSERAVKRSRGTQVDTPIGHKAKGVQTCVHQINKSTQCSLIPAVTAPGITVSDDGLSSCNTTPTSTPVKKRHDDHEWIPEAGLIDDKLSKSKDYHSVEYSPATERKFIVFESQLRQLFTRCRECGCLAMLTALQTRGSLVHIEQECTNGQCWRRHTVWDSQPYIKDLPAGNLLISAAILFSGSLPTKVLRFLQHMNVASITLNTFFEHQSAILFPAVRVVWDGHQSQYLQMMQRRSDALCLGGDGRADTPGHCAKYGTYTVLDLDLMKVVHIEVVQSNEAGGSAKMELQGLKQSMEFIQHYNLQVGQLVTDRHPSVVKWMRENNPSVRHSFDVWHVGKGLKKKLTKLANEKECDSLQHWIRSIVNHLYWVAISTPDGTPRQGAVMLDKWKSLTNHIHNKHQHQLDLFPECQHPDLAATDRKKPWIKGGSKLSAKLSDILESKMILRDVPKLSTGPQTAAIEGFHSVVNHFAPKMIGFSYQGMIHRNILAALHFNENRERDQATRSDGSLRYRIAFRKAKKNFALQEKKVEPTYVYVSKLLAATEQLAGNFSLAQLKKKAAETMAAPPPICAMYEDQRPSLTAAIELQHTRFKKQ